MSGVFLSTTTLASSLYLLVCRFLGCQYGQVVQVRDPPCMRTASLPGSRLDSPVQHIISLQVRLGGHFCAVHAVADTLRSVCLTTKSYLRLQIAESCPSDTPLSAEEKQIWDSLEAVVHNRHPDACACRLRLSILTVRA